MSVVPRVSVFIPVYNHEAYVGAAVESVLSQDFTDFELILVDDASQDDSLGVLRRYDDSRVRLYCNETNLGISPNRNRGLDLARGEFIALLDSDDRMAPQRLSRQVAFLDANPDIATVGGLVAKCDAEGRPFKHLARPLVPEQLHPWLLFRCSHANTSFMGRTAILRDFPYDPDFFTSGDYDLSVRLAERFPSANLPYVLSYLRQHDARTTSTASDRVKREKFSLAARQLGRLGIVPSTSDLERHYRLTRLTKDDIRSDPDYLDWTCAWLSRIAHANRTTGIYDERGLRAILSFVWTQTCLKASKCIGKRQAYLRFRQSPWRVGTHVMLAGNVRAAARRLGSR